MTALVLVRQALGEDAVVLSTKPSADGVEVLAMAPEGMRQVERMAAAAPTTHAPEPAPRSLAARAAERDRLPAPASAAARPVEDDVTELSMSTLSFQDYVRERMLRRRQASLAESRREPVAEPVLAAPPPAPPARTSSASRASVLEKRINENSQQQGSPIISAPGLRDAPPRETRRREPPVLRDAVAAPHGDAHAEPHGTLPRAGLADPHSEVQAVARRAAQPAFAVQPLPAGTFPTQTPPMREQEDMLTELRQVKGLIEERFGALAFMEKLNRQPAQARLAQRLLDCGFSPALIRKLGDSLPMDAADEAAWAAGVLERNLVTAEHESPLEDQGGVYAMVGATGVGKTTTTAKIAAAFATRYGAANLGLITLDAYRIGAHEQLRAYGRILGVPVHTAHDRASLEDLLELLAAKKMVLIDTAGMAQRDSRTRELLDMLSHRAIRKILVVNAASQGETIEDVMISYHASLCAGIVLSKMDEAVKLGPALDALIRHKLKVLGVANGQRVPEDWHRLSANALVQRAMRGGGSSAYKLDANDVNLIFTAPMPSAHTAPGTSRPAFHI